MAFRQAGQRNLGGKFLAFGDTGTGKTFFLLTFPGVAAVDSENGLSFYEGRPVNIGGNEYCNLLMVDNTADVDTLLENLTAALDGDLDIEYQTFGIDSETKFYAALQVAAMEVEERRARKTGGDIDDATVSQRQWGRIKLINMKLQQLKIDLSAKGIHVVSIAQSADLRDKKNTDRIIGAKPDMHKSVPYDYDVVLHFTKKKGTDGTEEFSATVIKDRTQVTTPGQVIPNCTFDVWRPYFEGRSGCDAAQTNYRKDLDTTVNSLTSDADKAAELVAQWKESMKVLKDAGNADAVKLVNAKMRALGIDVKSLTQQPSKTLQELHSYTAKLAAA